MINPTGLVSTSTHNLVTMPCDQDRVMLIADSIKTMGYCPMIPYIVLPYIALEAEESEVDSKYNVIFGSEFVEAYKIVYPNQQMPCMLILPEHESLLLESILSGMVGSLSKGAVSCGVTETAPDVQSEPPQAKPKAKARKSKVVDWWKSRKTGGMEPTQEDLDIFLEYIGKGDHVMRVDSEKAIYDNMSMQGWNLLRTQKMIAWCKQHSIGANLECVSAEKPKKKAVIKAVKAILNLTLEERLAIAGDKFEAAHEYMLQIKNDFLNEIKLRVNEIKLRVLDDTQCGAGVFKDEASSADVMGLLLSHLEYQAAKKKFRAAKASVTRSKNAYYKILGVD